MCTFATNDQRAYLAHLFDSVRNWIVLEPVVPVTISELPCGHFGTCFREFNMVSNDVHNAISLEQWAWLASFERQWNQRVRQDNLN